MKQFSTLLLLLCLLAAPRLNAQVPDTTIATPNGNFEQWSNGNGYSVTALIFPLTVYSSYTYPTGWNYPAYPVNETFSYSGVNLNINTDIPLLKVSNETSNVYEGSHALKMQSFLLSDILGSVIYGLIQSSLDPTLTSTAFPTILSTGNVNLEQFLPLVFDLADDFDDMTQLVSVLDTLNLSNIIDGGIPLDSMVPTRLTGHYKYTSADSGDNGGILMIGTRYNPETHQRRVVGAGFTIALTDTSEYTPFEVTYASLSDILPSAAHVEADSLIIFLFSSANISPQQGSALYIDNLQLWGHEPIDTCSAVFDLHLINVDTTHATIGWGFEGEPDHFEAEYGPQGFAQGSGTLVGTTESFLHLSNLQPDTWYDVYVRCVCDEDLYGEWDMLTFHTDTLIHTGIRTIADDNLLIYPNPAQGQCTVQFERETPNVVRLFTIEGVLVQEIIPTRESIELTLPANGVYLLVCDMKEGTVVRKVVGR